MVFIEDNLPEKIHYGEDTTKIKPEPDDSLTNGNQSYKIQKNCSDILNQNICVNQSNCRWIDSKGYDIGHCETLANPFAFVSLLVLLIPIAYGIMYKFTSPKLTKLIWTEKHTKFKYTYITSSIIAIVGLFNIVYNINYSQKYDSAKKDYWTYLLVFIIGATLCPIIIFLVLDFDFNKYWVLICLLTTSIGAVWLLTKYLALVDRKAYFDMGLTYYFMFHVIFIDNFLWWLAFSAS